MGVGERARVPRETSITASPERSPRDLRAISARSPRDLHAISARLLGRLRVEPIEDRVRAARPARPGEFGELLHVETARVIDVVLRRYTQPDSYGKIAERVPRGFPITTHLLHELDRARGAHVDAALPERVRELAHANVARPVGIDRLERALRHKLLRERDELSQEQPRQQQ